mmetsp:Transcript_18874/g.30058  ORF Transcript_18874/g.30058 Transcript_18874/m.30058 type:complete len:101 (-) Transcript_18874:534-836(-)
MQFFGRIVAQLLQGPVGEKLASSHFMRNLAQQTHKAMEQGGKMAAEGKVTWDAQRKILSQNAQQMKQEVHSSPVTAYLKGLKDEVGEFKQQFTDKPMNKK